MISSDPFTMTLSLYTGRTTKWTGNLKGVRSSQVLRPWQALQRNHKRILATIHRVQWGQNKYSREYEHVWHFGPINIVSKNTMVILSANYVICKIISQHSNLYPQASVGVQIVFTQREFETSSTVQITRGWKLNFLISFFILCIN